MPTLDDGWNPYWISSPPDNVLIELNREEWERPHVCYKKDINPATNILGLFWRLTGIGNEQLEEAFPIPYTMRGFYNSKDNSGKLCFLGW